MKNIRNNIDKILEGVIIAYGITGVLAVVMAIIIATTNPADSKASLFPLYVVVAFGLSFFLLIALVKAIVKRHYVISGDWQTIYNRKREKHKDTAVAIASHVFDIIDDHPIMLLTSDELSKRYINKLQKTFDPTFKSTVGVQSDTKLLTRNVYIRPEDLVIDGDARTYCIAKLELQPIEGYYVQCFNLRSDTRESIIDGYLRVTFEPIENYVED
jgi:hypothetical protein